MMSEAIKDDIKLTEELKILIELSLNEENRDVACNITALKMGQLIANTKNLLWNDQLSIILLRELTKLDSDPLSINSELNFLPVTLWPINT